MFNLSKLLLVTIFVASYAVAAVPPQVPPQVPPLGFDPTVVQQVPPIQEPPQPAPEMQPMQVAPAESQYPAPEAPKKIKNAPKKRKVGTKCKVGHKADNEATKALNLGA